MGDFGKEPYTMNEIEFVENALSKETKKSAPNPKDLIGAKKVDMSLIPSVAIAHLAMAMMDGAKKYGPYNWRDYPVEARTYVSAANRHLQAWLEREENAPDSGVHHLGHAMACCAILLDCLAEKQLIDNRPKSTFGYHQTLDHLNNLCKIKAGDPTAAPQYVNATSFAVISDGLLVAVPPDLGANGPPPKPM